MAYTAIFTVDVPEREKLDAEPGWLLLEFGTDWCGHCRAAQPAIAEALAAVPQIRHLKIEDGPGRRLGRSYRVKLWPTLILLRDGVEQVRAVRPLQARDLLAYWRPLLAG